MSVFEYVSKENQICFGVRYKAKSKYAKSVIIQREKRLGVIPKSEAKKEERKLIKLVENEVRTRELLGLAWKELLVEYEQASYKGLVDDKELSETTILDRVNTLRLYTLEWLNKPAASITSSDVKSIFKEMEIAGKSRSRIKALRSAINSVFRWGIQNRKINGIVESPASGLKLHKIDCKKQLILNYGQIRCLLEKAKEYQHDYYFIWAMALLTGCRSGELVALEWKDIDLENSVVNISKSWNKRINRIKSTKTNQWRDIPISPQLKTLLLEIKNASLDTQYVLPRITSWIRGDASKVLRGFCRSISIPEISFHALRACFTTMLLRQGVAVTKVMKLGGWTTYKAMEHYVRLAGVEIQGATESLDFLPKDSNNLIVLKSNGG